MRKMRTVCINFGRDSVAARLEHEGKNYSYQHIFVYEHATFHITKKIVSNTNASSKIFVGVGQKYRFVKVIRQFKIMGGECCIAGVAVATPTLPVPHQHFVQ